MLHVTQLMATARDCRGVALLHLHSLYSNKYANDCPRMLVVEANNAVHADTGRTCEAMETTAVARLHWVVAIFQTNSQQQASPVWLGRFSSGHQKFAFVLRYDELSRIESVCFLYSIVASCGSPMTKRIVSRICMHTRRESAERFQMDKMSS